MLAPFNELIYIGASSLGSSVGTGVGSGVGVGENTGDDESGVLEGDSSGVGVGADVEVGSIEGVAVGVGGASIAWALRGMLESGISGVRYPSPVGGMNTVVFDPEKIKILERNGLLTK